VTYTYNYDQYGNRWHQNGPQSMQLSFSGNSTTNNNGMDGYSYDAAGNLLVDNAGHHYTYDAEGRIIKVVSQQTGTSCYVYDAEGQRVRKDTGSTNGCADTTELPPKSAHEIIRHLSLPATWLLIPQMCRVGARREPSTKRPRIAGCMLTTRTSLSNYAPNGATWTTKKG